MTALYKGNKNDFLKIAQTIVGCGVLHLGKIIYLI
jgi:hypothetical protein